jgi:hypothetical protein
MPTSPTIRSIGMATQREHSIIMMSPESEGSASYCVLATAPESVIYLKVDVK